jgi:hypothetical protein
MNNIVPRRSGSNVIAYRLSTRATLDDSYAVSSKEAEAWSSCRAQGKPSLEEAALIQCLAFSRSRGDALSQACRRRCRACATWHSASRHREAFFSIATTNASTPSPESTDFSALGHQGSFVKCIGLGLVSLEA